MIATAVASSPLRALGTLTDAVGITGGDAAPPTREITNVVFDAGSAAMGADTQETLASIRERLEGRSRSVAVIVHELSRADVELASRLANPHSDECLLLSARLRQRKAELMRRREEVAALARSAYDLGAADEGREVAARVRAIDRELGRTESALERVFELMRPGAERRAEQRTRAAALSLAGERVSRVRQELLALGVRPQQIETRTIRVALTPELAAGGRIRIWIR